MGFSSTARTYWYIDQDIIHILGEAFQRELLDDINNCSGLRLRTEFSWLREVLVFVRLPHQRISWFYKRQRTPLPAERLPASKGLIPYIHCAGDRRRRRVFVPASSASYLHNINMPDSSN